MMLATEVDAATRAHQSRAPAALTATQDAARFARNVRNAFEEDPGRDHPSGGLQSGGRGLPTGSRFNSGNRVQRSDADLVRLCIDGNADAWNELVDRFGRLVYSISIKCGLAGNDADDVFQTVFGIVLRKLNELRDESRLAGWIGRTAQREAWRMRRRRRGEPLTLDDAAEPAADDDVDLARAEQQHIVRRGLSELGGRCQELLEALFLGADDPDYQTIAERLGIPVGSIGPTRARCFTKLEAILKKLGIADSDVE